MRSRPLLSKQPDRFCFVSETVNKTNRSRCRANMAHIRQSGPEFGSHFQLKRLETSTVFPFRTRKRCDHRGTSLIRKYTPLGPNRRPMPRVLGRSYRDGRFLMGEVALYSTFVPRGSDPRSPKMPLFFVH
jgi:hypothetical protein